MTPTDNEFYEAYKKSASFCDDLYQKEREKNYKSGIKYYIEDMDSSNYTYLNGIRVMPGHPKKLQEEDRIRLSDEEFIFRKGE